MMNAEQKKVKNRVSSLDNKLADKLEISWHFHTRTIIFKLINAAFYEFQHEIDGEAHI